MGGRFPEEAVQPQPLPRVGKHPATPGQEPQESLQEGDEALSGGPSIQNQRRRVAECRDLHAPVCLRQAWGWGRDLVDGPWIDDGQEDPEAREDQGSTPRFR